MFFRIKTRLENLQQNVALRFKRELVRYRKISYSQSGEDLIVQFIFENILRLNCPSYIDVGAHHPYYLSNTALFYTHGSRGLNIEPDPNNFKKFLKHRKEDINVNIGISSQKSTMTFYEMQNSSLNTFSEYEADLIKDQIIARKLIQSDTLDSVIKQHFFGKVPDYLSMDIEGLDEEVIRSLNFDIFRPRVICLETIRYLGQDTWKKDRDLIDYVCCQGYEVHSDTCINTIFLREEDFRPFLKSL